MTEITTFAQILLVTAFTALPIIVLVRLLPGDDTVSLADIVSASGGRQWPRGVQEEEPMRWGTMPAR